MPHTDWYTEIHKGDTFGRNDRKLFESKEDAEECKRLIIQGYLSSNDIGYLNHSTTPVLYQKAKRLAKKLGHTFLVTVYAVHDLQP
jgi:hypothetical protein